MNNFCTTCISVELFQTKMFKRCIFFILTSHLLVERDRKIGNKSQQKIICQNALKVFFLKVPWKHKIVFDNPNNSLRNGNG